MYAGDRRVLVRNHLGVVTDRDLHYISRRGKTARWAILPIRRITTIDCEEDWRPYFAAFFAVLSMTSYFGAVSILVERGITSSTFSAAAAATFMGSLFLWQVVWQRGFVRIIATTVDGHLLLVGLGRARDIPSASAIVAAVRSRIGGHEFSDVHDQERLFCRRARDARVSQGKLAR